MEKKGTKEADSCERPISQAYRQIGTDLAQDDLENDIPFADLQDL